MLGLGLRAKPGPEARVDARARTTYKCMEGYRRAGIMVAKAKARARTTYTGMEGLGRV